MPCSHAATCAQCTQSSRSRVMLSSSSHAIEEGGCSRPASPAASRMHLMTLRLRACISALCDTWRSSASDRPGTPCINSGVRSALGPGLRSLRREYSLHGGADHPAPTMPLHATRRIRRWRESLSMSMPGATATAMSNGWEQSQPMRCIACVRGACWPENKSRKRRGCWADLRAGTGVRDLGCVAELCSVAGVSAAATGATRRPLIPYAWSCWRQGVLGECGLGTTRPSAL